MDATAGRGGAAPPPAAAAAGPVPPLPIAPPAAPGTAAAVSAVVPASGATFPATSTTGIDPGDANSSSAAAAAAATAAAASLTAAGGGGGGGGGTLVVTALASLPWTRVVEDGPRVQALVDSAVDQAEQLGAWAQTLQRQARGFVRAMASSKTAADELANSVAGLADIEVVPDDVADPLITGFTEGTVAVGTHRKTFIADMDRQLVGALFTYEMAELAAIRDARRALAKAQDRYDLALARYAATPTGSSGGGGSKGAIRRESLLTTAPPAADDPAATNALLEARRAYLSASLELVRCLKRTLAKAQIQTAEWILDHMFTMVDFYTRSMQAWQLQRPAMEEVRTKLKARRGVILADQANVDSAYRKAAEDIAALRPRSEPDPERMKATELAGYLWHKVSGRAKGAAGSAWQRIYCILHEGRLDFRQYIRLKGKDAASSAITNSAALMLSLGGDLLGGAGMIAGGVNVGAGSATASLGASATGSRTAVSLTSGVLVANVLMCATKLMPQAERRHCFELKSSTETHLLQAETDAEVQEWLAAIANAKKSALAVHSDGQAVAQHVHRQLAATDSTPDESSMDDVGRKALSVFRKDKTAGPAAAAGAAGAGAAAAAGPGPGPGPGAAGGPSVPGGPGPATGVVVYRSAEYAKKNSDLHAAVPGTPAHETCFEALRCLLQTSRDAGVRGRLFLTQCGFHFVSNVLGSMRHLSVAWTDVQKIDQSRNSVFVTVDVAIMSGKHYSIKYTALAVDQVGLAIEGLWKDACSEAPTATAALFEKLYRQMDVAAASTVDSGVDGAGRTTVNRADTDDDDDDDDDDDSGDDDAAEGHADNASDSTTDGQSEGAAVFEPHPDVYVDRVFPVSADRLFLMLYEHTSVSAQRVWRRSGRVNMSVDDWSNGLIPGSSRKLVFQGSFAPALTGMAATKAQCYETSTIVQMQPRERFVIDHIYVVPDAPFGESFAIHSRVNICAVSATSARFHLSMAVVFNRNVFMVKGLLKTQAHKSFSAQAHDVIAAIRSECRAAARLGTAAEASVPTAAAAAPVASAAPALAVTAAGASDAATPTSAAAVAAAAAASAAAAALAAASSEAETARAEVAAARGQRQRYAVALWVVTVLLAVSLALNTATVWRAADADRIRAERDSAPPADGWCGDGFLRGTWRAGRWPLLSGKPARSLLSFAAFREALPVNLEYDAVDGNATTRFFDPATRAELARLRGIGAPLQYTCHRLERTRHAAVEAAYVRWLATEIERCLLEVARQPAGEAAQPFDVLCAQYQYDMLHLWTDAFPTSYM